MFIVHCSIINDDRLVWHTFEFCACAWNVSSVKTQQMPPSTDLLLTVSDHWSPPDDCHERPMKIKIMMTRKRLLILRLLTQFIAAVFPRVACGEAEKWSVVHDDNVDNLDDGDDDDEDSCLVTCTFHKKALVHTYSRRYIYRCHRLSFCSANITVIRWHCLHRCA